MYSLAAILMGCRSCEIFSRGYLAKEEKGRGQQLFRQDNSVIALLSRFVGDRRMYNGTRASCVIMILIKIHIRYTDGQYFQLLRRENACFLFIDACNRAPCAHPGLWRKSSETRARAASRAFNNCYDYLEEFFIMMSIWRVHSVLKY